MTTTTEFYARIKEAGYESEVHENVMDGGYTYWVNDAGVPMSEWLDKAGFEKSVQIKDYGMKWDQTENGLQYLPDIARVEIYSNGFLTIRHVEGSDTVGSVTANH